MSEEKPKVIKTIDVVESGVFKCACDDEGAVQGQTIFPLGRYKFWPCMRCARQIEAAIMGAVVTEGAKLAIEANLRRQELAGHDPMAAFKGK